MATTVKKGSRPESMDALAYKLSELYGQVENDEIPLEKAKVLVNIGGTIIKTFSTRIANNIAGNIKKAVSLDIPKPDKGAAGLLH